MLKSARVGWCALVLIVALSVQPLRGGPAHMQCGYLHRYAIAYAPPLDKFPHLPPRCGQVLWSPDQVLF